MEDSTLYRGSGVLCKHPYAKCPNSFDDDCRLFLYIICDVMKENESDVGSDMLLVPVKCMLYLHIMSMLKPGTCRTYIIEVI